MLDGVTDSERVDVPLSDDVGVAPLLVPVLSWEYEADNVRDSERSSLNEMV